MSVANSQNQKETQMQSGNYENGNGFENNQNRLPQLLRDIKILLSDALIADVMDDTLEAVYTLNRIFDLLT